MAMANLGIDALVFGELKVSQLSLAFFPHTTTAIPGSPHPAVRDMTPNTSLAISSNSGLFVAESIRASDLQGTTIIYSSSSKYLA
jgi:hypothetical protein